MWRIILPDSCALVNFRNSGGRKLQEVLCRNFFNNSNLKTSLQHIIIFSIYSVPSVFSLHVHYLVLILTTSMGASRVTTLTGRRSPSCHPPKIVDPRAVWWAGPPHSGPFVSLARLHFISCGTPSPGTLSSIKCQEKVCHNASIGGDDGDLPYSLFNLFLHGSKSVKGVGRRAVATPLCSALSSCSCTTRQEEHERGGERATVMEASIMVAVPLPLSGFVFLQTPGICMRT